MKVILLVDVKKVGKKHEIVEVSQGYAQNVLFKGNLAMEADKANMSKLNKIQDNMKQAHDADVKAATSIKKQLENMELVFKLSSGKNGNVFGSVSTKQIAQALKQKGFNIDKKSIKSDGINHMGYDKVTIELHKEVIAELKIKVEEK